MDAVLDNVSISLYNGLLPNEWRRLAPATCKNLGGWIEHFLRRVMQYNIWVCFKNKLNVPKQLYLFFVLMVEKINLWPLKEMMSSKHSGPQVQCQLS